MSEEENKFPDCFTVDCYNINKKTKRYECAFCDVTLANRKNAKRHFEGQHLKIRYKCEHCDFTVGKKYNLKAHTCYIRRTKEGKILKEIDVQKRLEKELKGRSKKCKAGFVDIVTQTHIVEIKCWKRYREAIGQILVYSHFYPGKQMRLHFFGIEPKQVLKTAIESTCSKLGIEVTSE